MPSAETALTALTVCAGLALLVERTLEFMKHLIEFGNGSLSPREIAALQQRAEEKAARAENALNALKAGVPPPEGGTMPQSEQSVDAPPPQAEVADGPLDAEPSERFPAPHIPVEPMKPLSPQETANVLFLQFAAGALGILLAYVFDLQLLSKLYTLADGIAVYPSLDRLFTGIVIGGGSQPVHLLIRFITERKVDVPQAARSDDPEKDIQNTRALAKVVFAQNFVEEKKEAQPFQWSTLAYTGGVTPERLENYHRRKHNADLIVYHHTAMSSSSSFQDVVDEFIVGKKWPTGYHCVVMPEGTVKPFCRWDRYGNHALGVNDRSLGIAFHGNFHTEAGDAFSNADGRYGNQRPTEAQLHAGARVIALWANLYGLKPEFGMSIKPHSAASAAGHTVCPGSNFPHDKLEELVQKYYDAWSHSAEAQRGLLEFRSLRYVYAA